MKKPKEFNILWKKNSTLLFSLMHKHETQSNLFLLNKDTPYNGNSHDLLE